MRKIVLCVGVMMLMGCEGPVKQETNSGLGVVFGEGWNVPDLQVSEDVWWDEIPEEIRLLSNVGSVTSKAIVNSGGIQTIWVYANAEDRDLYSAYYRLDGELMTVEKETIVYDQEKWHDGRDATEHDLVHEDYIWDNDRNIVINDGILDPVQVLADAEIYYEYWVNNYVN